MLVIAEHIKCRSPIDRHCALPESLDALIRHRVDLLTQYQDGAYATQYEKAVNKLRDVEGDPAFLQKLRDQFDGEPGKDYELNFNLAPPRLARRDANGHLKKKSYGPWMLYVFRVLAKLKHLRGTAFDPFGRTAERASWSADLSASISQ